LICGGASVAESIAAFWTAALFDVSSPLSKLLRLGLERLLLPVVLLLDLRVRDRQELKLSGFDGSTATS
jgi:hypothetical protein